MARSEKLDWLDITDFKGAEAPNVLPKDPSLTRDLVNMHIEEGSLVPRPGAASESPLVAFHRAPCSAWKHHGLHAMDATGITCSSCVGSWVRL